MCTCPGHQSGYTARPAGLEGYDREMKETYLAHMLVLCGLHPFY